MRVPERIRALASLLPEGCRCAADIGTDHRLLPILALKEGRAERCIACDLREGPLAAARRNAAAAGVSDRVDFRLADGLAGLSPGEADCIVIAGMGGETVAGILERGREAALTAGKLILSPQSQLSLVRRWLSDNGFRIAREDLLTEEGKTYLLLCAEPGEERLSEVQAAFGPRLLERRDGLLRGILKSKRDRLARILEKMPQESRRRADVLAEAALVREGLDAWSAGPKKTDENGPRPFDVM